MTSEIHCGLDCSGIRRERFSSTHPNRSNLSNLFENIREHFVIYSVVTRFFQLPRKSTLAMPMYVEQDVVEQRAAVARSDQIAQSALSLSPQNQAA